MAIARIFQPDFHFKFHFAPCNVLENMLGPGPGSWHTQLILVRTFTGRDGGVHAARARGAEGGAALAQVDLHGSGRAAAPEAAAAVVHAAARAAHLGARGFGGGQVREGGAVRVAAAVLPRQLAPRCGHATRPRGDFIDFKSSLAPPGLFHTRIIPCYPYRVETGPYCVPVFAHAFCKRDLKGSGGS